MSFELIRYEVRGPAAWVVFNQPEKMNPISPAWAAEVEKALTEAERDPAVRSVVLTGSGRAFSAGGDLSRAETAYSTGDELLANFTRPLAAALKRVREFPKPVIAAINGICLAGGMELLLCCDIVYAAESAKIGDGHSVYGLLPAIGGAQNLVRNVGLLRAKELLFTGTGITSNELMQIGLLNKVVPDRELEAAVTDLVELLARRSPRGLAIMKRMANESSHLDWDAAVELDFALNSEYLDGPEAAEGLRAFLEKRRPEFPPLPA